MYSGRRPSADRRRTRSRGFSLLDALAGVTFIAVAILGLSAASVALTRNSKGADSTSAATALAQQKLEQLRSMPLNATQLDPGIYYDAGNKLKADGTSGGIFDRSWLVSLKDTPRPGLKTVTVTVAWTDSRSHSTQVASFVRCNAVPCQ
ncbi:MAG: hypothetical protein E6J79_05435 [Deltaproteobacteria bacterium]|nr:MAG: hypothetical protein E6J79_05435 [Deltaproteobacteria bacterium]